MKPLPTLRCFLTNGLTSNVEHSVSPVCTSNTFSWTVWVRTISFQLKPCTVNLFGVTWMSSCAADGPETHEWLQAKSDKASSVSVLVRDCYLSSEISNKPLTLVWDTTPELSPDSFFTDTEELLVALFSLGSGLGGKTFSAPCNKMLWELEHPSAVYLRLFDHCPFRHKKQSLLSATTFACFVGVFSRNTGQRHKVSFFYKWNT